MKIEELKLFSCYTSHMECQASISEKKQKDEIDYK